MLLLLLLLLLLWISIFLITSSFLRVNDWGRLQDPGPPGGRRDGEVAGVGYCRSGEVQDDHFHVGIMVPMVVIVLILMMMMMLK